MYNNTDICVASGPRFSSTGLYTPQSLADLFHGYNKGKEGFIEFCKGENSWRAPNTSLVRFNYCPITGAKIDWEQVLDEGLKYFKD